MRRDDPTSAFASVLRRFQRRLRVSAFARGVPVAGAIALGVLDVALLAFPQPRTVSMLAWVAAIAFAVLAAWAVAVLRTPSLAATAPIVDRHFRLQDSCVTALQFSPASDAVSRLVVADALSRLETRSAALLPLAVSSRAIGVAAALAAATLVVIAQPGRGVVPAVTIESGQSPGPAGGAERPISPRARAGGASAGAPSEAGGRASAAATPLRVPAREAARSGADKARTGAPPSGARTAAPGATDDRGGTAAQTPSVPDGRNGGLAASRRASAGGGREANGNAGPGRAGSGLSAAGRGARGRAIGDAAAGGVAGGAFVGGAARTAIEAPASDDFDTAAYRAAYARAEAAMANERVPPRLRSYVRDYFVAIRPERGP